MKKISYCGWLYFIFLLAFILLFSITSLALIPGDFGSADNGPPDGIVDFEDLMIFALAYGSTSADTNWNPDCDIAGLGSTIPDEVIDFEDLMIFAMHYGRRDVVSDIDVTAITYQFSMSKFVDIKSKLEEDKLKATYYFNELTEPKKGVTGYAIDVGWHGYYDATGYRVYRSVNGGDYSIILDEEISGYTWYGRWDDDVSPGNTYSYYVTAYGPDWETEPSEIVTRDTFLPPCPLISPPDGSVVSDPNPVFTWNPVGISNFPYESMHSGESGLWICDDTAGEEVWWTWFDNMTTSTATYNQDGQATPLVAGHSYRWVSYAVGFDENNDLIAVSQSEYWYFGYGDPVVFNVNAYTITYQSSMSKLADTITELEEEGKLPPTYYLNEPQELAKGVTGYEICVNWHSYYEATGYRVYRSVDGGGSYSVVFDESASGYTWYGIWDNEVSPGNTYSYYVTAYGDFGETDPSQIVTRDTFLPPCSLISPPDGSVVSESTPTFTWNPAGVSAFPYDSTIYSGETYLRVYDASTYDTFWRIWFEDMTTSTAIYNQDGYATPLVSDSTYKWYACSHGYDESGNLIAVSQSEYWDFVYSGGALAGITKVIATAQTYYSSTMFKYFILGSEKSWPGQGYFFNESELLEKTEKAELNHSISLSWSAYFETTGCGYRIYRRINVEAYEVVFSQEAPTGYDWYGWVDNEAGPGNIYSYYVTAYGLDWETDPSEIVTIDTWLPPCTLNSPPDGAVIDINPTFFWSSGAPDFPCGPLYSGGTCMLVYDLTTHKFVWIICFDDPATSTTTYNQDGQATPLISGHSYTWHSWTSGYDENWNRIAVSESEHWSFDYIGE